MVVFHVKDGQQDGFLYEASVQDSNDALIRGLANLWNKRLRLGLLAGSVRELAKYGPMKASEDQGIDAIKEEYEGTNIEKSGTYAADPTGNRTGNAPPAQLVETMERVCQDAEDALSPTLVKQRVALTSEMLDDKISNIRGAVMMAYPMGLPAWDTVSLALDGDDAALEGTPAAAQMLDPDTASLWVASRDFQRDQKVGDRLGWNEKTKVVAKLQKEGSGPPAREPAVSEEERKAMMAHYFKRQEQLKKLSEASDDDYLSSSWADPKALQRSLRGQGGVRAPGMKL